MVDVVTMIHLGQQLGDAFPENLLRAGKEIGQCGVPMGDVGKKSPVYMKPDMHNPIPIHKTKPVQR